MQYNLNCVAMVLKDIEICIIVMTNLSYEFQIANDKTEIVI